VDFFDLKKGDSVCTQKIVDNLTYKVVGAAIRVQQGMKSGVKEAVYEECLTIELDRLGIPYRQQFSFRPTYRGQLLKSTSVVDLIVDDLLIVELKAVKAILPTHMAPALNYINLLGLPKALILNFNSINIATEGRKTVVNSVYAELW
jgi:GxxExxY protein